MHPDLLDTAIKLLLTVNTDAPSQSDLRRSVSTAYYSMFHFVAQSCSFSLASGSAKQLKRAENQVARSLDHRDIVSACAFALDIANGFPSEIKEFSSAFRDLNRCRSRADYDSTADGDFSLPYALSKVSDAETAIRRFQSAHPDDQRAFAILCAVKPPRGERR